MEAQLLRMVRRNLGMTIDPVVPSSTTATFDDVTTDQKSPPPITSENIKSSIQKFVSIRKALRMSSQNGGDEETDQKISRVKREMFRVRHLYNA